MPCSPERSTRHLHSKTSLPRAAPDFGGDLRSFSGAKKKPQVSRKRRGSPALPGDFAADMAPLRHGDIKR